MADVGIDRLASSVLSSMGRWMWGFPPRIMPTAVEDMGGGRALRWFGSNMPRFLLTRQRIGPIRTHLSCIAISLRNSCTYCAYGHAYALELLYLREHDRLFPLDAETLAGWPELPPRELAGRLRQLLHEAGMHAEVRWVDLTLALASGEQHPVSREEARLVHLIGMVAQMNRIAVTHCVANDEAHDPINKDAAVKARHAALRAAVH